MGPAGAGKGTLASKIKESFDIAHIATGNMFRAEIANKTELGLTAKTYIEAGLLVPDDVTIEMVTLRLSKEDCEHGFLLDGFPRTITQAEALHEALSKEDKDIELVLNLVINYDSLAKRIVGRRICENCDAIYNVVFTPSKVENICDRCGAKLIQRSDDTEVQLKIRMEEYYKRTETVLDYYRSIDKLVDIDANALPDEVWSEVYGVLKEVNG